MELRHYALKPPYTRTYFTVPGYVQDTLHRHGLAPIQEDGECLTALAMAAHYGPQDEADGPMGHFAPFLLIDPYREPTGVVGTEFFTFLINSTLQRMPQPTTDDDEAAVSLAFARLMDATAKGRHSLLYDARERRWAAEDRDNWLRTPMEPLPALRELTKWKHWKPGRIRELEPTTQRRLEGDLRIQWARRLIAHLSPHANDIPHLRSLQGDDLLQEYMDLLGDTRFRTLRIHCLGLEELQRMGFNKIPWDEAAVRALLNRLREMEATPHKIQRIWDTLRWFSKRFGLLDVTSMERLQEKRKALQDQLTPTVIKPQRKAMVPSKEVIWALESGTAGVPPPGASSPDRGGTHPLDQFILGVVRFQVACSARFNDLQHTSTASLQVNSSTVELSAWQTKTVSAFKMKKSPVPLIAPKYSFTGHDWWTPLTIAWRKMHALDAFVNSDYLIPTLSKDGLGLIPRPSSPDRALRWLKAALGRRGLQSHQVDKLSWHSFRVFIPDCAFQLRIPRDQRQYLGNWTTESTADIYTREKRNVVTRVWEEVALKLPSLNLGGARLVREDLDHPDWEDPMVVTIDDAGAGQPSTPPGNAPQAGAGEPGNSPPLRPSSWDLVEQGKVPADSVADSTGPWRVISTTMRRKGAQVFKVHLLDTHGRTIGCGWTPNLARVTELSVDDYVADIDSHICCERCFKNHTFPKTWGLPGSPDAQAPSASSPDSDDSLTDESVDTASEEEKITVETLNNSHERMDT